MKTVFSIIVLLLCSMQGLDARRAKPSGASLGVDGTANGDGLALYTSPGALNQTELRTLNNALESFENSRTRGPIEQTLVSPFAQSQPEVGEQLVDVINNETRRRVLNVFLPDTRQEVDNTKYPFRTVGLFNGCTGTLIYDRGIMVTNSHCLNYKADGTLDPSTWTRTFYAGLKNGYYLRASTPKALWYNKYYDYAVIKLWDNLDDTLGRMGVQWTSISYFNTNRPLQMISYSGDHCTSWNTCRSKISTGWSRGTINSRDVKHDLDAKRGSSGSSLFVYSGGWPIVQALNWGEYRGESTQSLTVKTYVANKANVAKPAGVWQYGYDQVKNF